MSILLWCQLIVLLSTTLAPSSEELHNRYGTPDSAHRNSNGVLDSESFSMRPWALLTAYYGSDHRACRIKLLPGLDLENPLRYPFGLEGPVSEILEEVAPVALRGKEFGEGMTHSIRVTEYENILLKQKADSSGISDITIFFKRDGCPKPDNPFVFLAPPDAKTMLALTPTSEELHKRYAPNSAWSAAEVFDIFILRPEIQLSVKYGSDHHACSIAIEPVDGSNPYIPKEKVSELLDELALAAMRGREIAGYGEFRSSCLGVGMAIYENVFIGRWPNYCVPEHPGTDKGASIQFKRDVCPNPYTPATTNLPNSR